MCTDNFYKGMGGREGGRGEREKGPRVVPAQLSCLGGSVARASA